MFIYYINNGDYLIAFINDASRKVFSLEYSFMNFCKEQNIKQRFTSASRPQTNGKIERWFGTYKQKRPLFETRKEFQNCYNNSSHGNLGWKFAKFESPNEAFTRKMH